MNFLMLRCRTNGNSAPFSVGFPYCPFMKACSGGAPSWDASDRAGHNAGVAGPCHSRCRLVCAPPCEYGRGRACRCHRQYPACDRTRRGSLGSGCGNKTGLRRRMARSRRNAFRSNSASPRSSGFQRGPAECGPCRSRAAPRDGRGPPARARHSGCRCDQSAGCRKRRLSAAHQGDLFRSLHALIRPPTANASGQSPAPPRRRKRAFPRICPSAQALVRSP